MPLSQRVCCLLRVDLLHALSHAVDADGRVSKDWKYYARKRARRGLENSRFLAPIFLVLLHSFNYFILPRLGAALSVCDWLRCYVVDWTLLLLGVARIGCDRLAWLCAVLISRRADNSVKEKLELRVGKTRVNGEEKSVKRSM